MSTVIIPGRTAKGLRPAGSFGLNGGSWQAMGLMAWYPMWPSLLSATPVAPLNKNTSVSVASATNLGGTCGSYNGTTSFLNRTIGIPLVSAPPFTVAVWFYPTAVGGGSARKLWMEADGSFFGWYFNLGTGGTLDWQSYNGSTGQASSSTNPTTNVWQHAVGVEALVNSRACYLNGGNKGTNSTSITVSQNASQTTEAVGCQSVIGTQSDFFSGLIAEVRVYNRALTDNEVWGLYDPATRWDLYWQPSRRVYVFQSSAAGYLLVKN